MPMTSSRTHTKHSFLAYCMSKYTKEDLEKFDSLLELAGQHATIVSKDLGYSADARGMVVNLCIKKVEQNDFR